MPAQSRILVWNGVIGDKSVKILIDPGASTNRINPGMASKDLSSQKIQARRFDGTMDTESARQESGRRNGVLKDAVHGTGVTGYT